MALRAARWALAATLFVCAAPPAHAAVLGPVAFIPLDDRPVTLQLPVMLGDIAGISVRTPRVAALGHYLTPGDPDAVIAWLRSSTNDCPYVVASLDMAVYGGLVASRVPGLSAGDGYFRLRQFAAAVATRPAGNVATFGTVMRLAPTGVPQAPQTAGYWARGDTVDLIAQYANLPEPPRTEEQRALARRLRARIGPARLDAYLSARNRNRNVDQFALQLVAENAFGETILGQDDAGPSGLHIADLAALRRTALRFDLGNRASIEPGADELGMVLVAHAFTSALSWTPRVRVRYSHPGAGALQDHLEFAPINETISHLIAASGALRTDATPDIDLFVRVAGNTELEELATVDGIAADVAAGIPVAVADLSFLVGDPGIEQEWLTRELVNRGLAGKIDAFASWNTNANTVGTALATAIATEVGRRNGTFDERAHAQFMLDRYADDYVFHQFVRPILNEDLRSQGIDTTLLAEPALSYADSLNRRLLWPDALSMLDAIYPAYRDDGLTITLPWQRTFEAMLDVRLAPR